MRPGSPSPKVWLFDLDNTLHNASEHIFPHINHSMTTYIRNHLGVNEIEATLLRQNYWQRYGATLHGLMRHHGVNPQHFLWNTHQFPDLSDMLVFERTLKTTLRRIPGRKFIFSNAPGHYTNAVLALMRICPCFEGIYPLERFRYHAKPMPSGFLHLLRKERLDPQRCVMVEDSLDNLKTAKQLGMVTVWISKECRKPPCVDIKIRSLRELPARFNQLQHKPISP